MLAALAACGDPNDNDVCIAEVYHPLSLSVVEGQSVPFDIALAPSSPCDADGQVEFSLVGKLAATPPTFSLTRKAPMQTLTLLALDDVDAISETVTLVLYQYGTIDNESPELLVNIVDNDAP